LPELVDRSVDIAPPAGDLDIGLVDLPAVADGMAAGPGGLGQQRRKPQHPPIDRDVVDLDAAFGEQLLDVAVPQRETQVLADRQHDHIRREAEADEGRWRDSSMARTAGSHDTSLSARARSQQMQQRPLCHSSRGTPLVSATFNRRGL
jgi:hypothetical protein